MSEPSEAMIEAGCVAYGENIGKPVEHAVSAIYTAMQDAQRTAVIDLTLGQIDAVLARRPLVEGE
jgi:hypothetical protein